MSEKLDERPIFNLEKANLGIKRACEAFDELELTLTERFWVCHCLVKAVSGLLGRKYSELEEMMREKHPEIAEKAEKPAE